MLLKVALKSLVNRRASALLTLFTLTLSIFVLLSIEDIRQQSKQSFNRAISGVDLIVGAPTGQLNLTLASAFGTGFLTNSVEWSSYQALQQHPQVKWAVPISLGDSHKGNRVIGTNSEYFELIKYGNKQAFAFAHGRTFNDNAFAAAEVVIGANIAAELGYQLGEELILSHGLGVTSFHHHDQVKFKLVGILQVTGTPADNALYVSLSGIERMHSDEGHDHSSHSKPISTGAAHEGHEHEGHEHEGHEHEGHEHEGHEHEGHEHEGHEHEGHEHEGHEHEGHEHEGHEHEGHEHEGHEHEGHEHEGHEHEGHEHEGHEHDGQKEASTQVNLEQVSAVFVGVKAKYATLMLQKYVNDYQREPLMAVLPGVALTELWRLLSTLEAVLMLIALLVLVSSLFGMCAMLLSSMQERKREIAVFRALGASKRFIFWLVQVEVLWLVLTASVLAVLLSYFSYWFIQPILLAKYGLFINAQLFTPEKLTLLAMVLAGAVVVGLLPAVTAYKKALGASLKH